MAEIRIRNVPDDVLAAIDANATRVRLSRNAYVLQLLRRAWVEDAEPVTVASLLRLAELAADLNDPDVMAGAWS